MSIRRVFDWNAISQKIVEGDKKKSYEQDEGFFQPKFSEDGTFNALVRFLPPNVSEDLPFQKLYSHGFQGDAGGWFIENCPTTIGQKCPICMDNGRIYDTNEDLAKNRKRKVSFYANILIVKNPNQPETEGKVFKFRYGIKIHDKIMEKIAPKNPEIDEMVPIFDYEKGANFKLKVKQTIIPKFKKPVPNYDASTFAEPSPISINGKALTDTQLDELENQIYKLGYLVDPKQFKSFDQLCTVYEDKMGSTIGVELKGGSSSRAASNSSAQSEDAPVESSSAKAGNKATKTETPAAAPAVGSEEDDDAFFARLRKGE
jgi:hypothetical protein